MFFIGTTKIILNVWARSGGKQIPGGEKIARKINKKSNI